MKRMKKVLFVLLCIALFIGSYLIGARGAMASFADQKFKSMKQQINASSFTVMKDVSYGEGDMNYYDLYLPESGKENYSLILHIHGGGFSAGDKKEGKIICEYYASKGYVTASVNYSLMDGKHDSNLNVMTEEILTAIEHLVSLSEEKGYHITEMATTGESAGGTLALLMGLKYGNETEVPVRFVMEESGPACFDPELWAAGSDDQQKIDFINNMTGLHMEVSEINSVQYQKAIDSISPSAFASKDSVPLLMAYGAGDVVVPPNIKEPLLKNLKESNARYDFILFPDSGHSLYNNPEQMKEYRAKMDEYVEKYFENK